MEKSIYKISKMDCPSEEQLVRMKLENINGILRMDFDIPNRTLTVLHNGDNEVISEQIGELNLDSKLIKSIETNEYAHLKIEESNQVKLLWTVLIINFGFFVIEMTTGIISKSMGLVADSLDMFADAAVYGMSLLAVGKAVSRKKLVAKLAGYFQFSLAVIGFIEVIRRFIDFEEIPDFQTMIIVSVLALIGNIFSLYLLQKAKNNEAHMQASMIFTSNDIIVNGGVITAGFLVSILDSKIPDLITGAIVFTFVIRGSFRILKLAIQKTNHIESN
ncbi:cation transporter [Melioribacter sp. OK-6-Me]|uniref:cation transporter n=1 Tax=Melioribacteraceae TaxID=1334117 RepID=UPI00336C2574